MRRILLWGAALGLAASTGAASCSLLNAPDESSPGETSSGGQGGASGGSSSSSTSSTTSTTGHGGQAGAPAECTTAEDCPGPVDACRHRVCVAKTCTIETPPQGTICQEGACASGVATVSQCDGNGSCVPGTVQECSPYVCNPQASACLTSCAQPGDCAAGFQCNNLGECAVLQSLGAPCSSGAECQSGFCPPQDGMCCASACDSSCQSCALSKNGLQDGSCGDVVPGTDPDNECPDPAVCMGQGSCACVPTGTRAPFNTLVENTTTGCVFSDPCPWDAYDWADFGPIFVNIGERISCSGAPSCVANVGITTYELVEYCQGVWDVQCDDVLVGTINTIGRACAGTAMTNGCNVSFSARLCSSIRLVASGGQSTCCAVGTPDAAISAVSAW